MNLTANRLLLFMMIAWFSFATINEYRKWSKGCDC
jgi:hypothetical protein